MKLNFLLAVVFIGFGGNSALALMPKSSVVIKDKTLNDRLCILEFRDGKRLETLSGVLIGVNRIVTVAHTDFFRKKLRIKCGVSGSALLPDMGRLQHPRYIKNDNPASVQEWGKYDVAVIGINAAYTAGIQPLPIISDIIEVRSLIAQGRCVYGGAGNDNTQDIKLMNSILVRTPHVISANVPTHATVRYPGKAEVVLGDSGGPLYCQRANNIWHLSGLINYAGTIKIKATGKTENLVGILVLRPELLNEFIYK